MKTNKLIKQGWEQTDGSLETMQYGKKLNETTWGYKEVDKSYLTEEEAIADFENWHTDVVDLSDYTKKEIGGALATYGYDIRYWTSQSVFNIEQNGYTYSVDDSIQLACECIFELEH